MLPDVPYVLRRKDPLSPDPYGALSNYRRLCLCRIRYRTLYEHDLLPAHTAKLGAERKGVVTFRAFHRKWTTALHMCSAGSAIPVMTHVSLAAGRAEAVLPGNAQPEPYVFFDAVGVRDEEIDVQAERNC